MSIQHDYNAVLSIIVLYYSEYAKYFSLKILNYIKLGKNIKFGDIVYVTDTDKYYVNDINNNLLYCGHYPFSRHSYIIINASICCHLSNAIEFYSKIIANDTFLDNSYFEVKPSDQFIIKHFGGPLSSEYQKITVYFIGTIFGGVTVQFTETFKHTFYPTQNSNLIFT